MSANVRSRQRDERARGSPSEETRQEGCIDASFERGEMCYLLFTDLFQQNINAANAVMQSRGHYYAERTNLCSQVYGVKRHGAEVYIKMSAGCHALSYVLAILHTCYLYTCN